MLKFIGRIIIAVITLSTSLAFGWGDMGHKIVANIAEETMNPMTKDFVRGVIGIEPMAISAIWPDHARDDARFGKRDSENDFSPYHFCEIQTGYDYKNTPGKSQKDAHGAIVHAIDVLKGKASREEKMIALRYLIHVVGDIHQPLHVGNGFDLGANACQIKWKSPKSNFESKMNFHSFWDEELVKYVGESYADDPQNSSKKPARYLPDYITNLKRKYSGWFTSEAKAKYASGAVEQWLAESQMIRENGLYPDDADAMKNVKKGEEHKFRPYCDWFVDQDRGVKGPGSKIDVSKIPTLDKTYADRFAPVVETQWLKGGLRLAVILDQIAEEAFKNRTTSPVNNSDEQTILKNIQDSFKN